MLKSLIHYLDTNIILAMALLGDNSFKDANEYLKQNIIPLLVQPLAMKLNKK